MNDFFTDLSGIYSTGLESTVKKTASHNTNSRLGQDLEMQDFMNLMVESLKHQSIDNTADISDMMNQMVQMSVVTAINNINEVITQSNNLTYAASLVGKEVTVAQRTGTQVRYLTGTITGTGMVNGQQAIFMGDKSYWMSDILSVGRLPGDETPSINRAEAEQPEVGQAVVEQPGVGQAEVEQPGVGQAEVEQPETEEPVYNGNANSVNNPANFPETVNDTIDTENSGAVNDAANAGYSGAVNDAANTENSGAATETTDAGTRAEALEAANSSVWTGRSGVVSIDESMDLDEEPIVEAASGASSL